MGWERFQQAAVIPWRSNGAKGIEVALITSRSGNRWIIPKGLIDPGETARESAMRECLEEAGLVGSVSRDPLGRYEYKKWGGICEVVVFGMRVDEELKSWDEDGFRDRKWVGLEEAERTLRNKMLSKLVRELPNLL